MARVAVTAQKKLDAGKLRADFPIFEQESRGKSLAYLDSAASSHKPRQVLDKLRTFYETSYANVHRGVYKLSEVATAEYEGAREKVARFVNAPEPRELIFTHGATESINLVAYAWGLDNLGPGDVALVTELEHHSNFVPWQYIAKRTGATFKTIPLDDHGELQLDSLDELAGSGRIKVVAANLVSNALGTFNRAGGSPRGRTSKGRSWSLTQRRPRRTTPSTFSSSTATSSCSRCSKLCGPTSVGALWGRAELLETMAPFNLGGHMIRSVKLEETTWGQLAVQVRGRNPADCRSRRFRRRRRLRHRSRSGCDRGARARAAGVRARQARRRARLRRLRPPPERRAGIVSFNIEGIHPHDVAQILDMEGVAIRAGHHCCQPLMSRLGVAATNRASFYLYTIPDEVDRLVGRPAQGT